MRRKVEILRGEYRGHFGYIDDSRIGTDKAAEIVVRGRIGGRAHLAEAVYVTLLEPQLCVPLGSEGQPFEGRHVVCVALRSLRIYNPLEELAELGTERPALLGKEDR